MNKTEILENMHNICAERRAMRAEINRTTAHYAIAGMALDYHYRELKLLDLVAFCNTGRYSQ